jgi:hypothetical protein
MDNSIKVYFSTPTELNIQLFKDNGICICETVDVADYVICTTECKHKELINKTIYISREPPKEKNVTWHYNNFDKFKLVVTYNPDASKSNQIPYNIYTYPNWTYVPSSSKKFITRECTKLRDRGIFFAGTTKVHQDTPFKGTVRIRHLRKIIGSYLIEKFPASVCIGIGWQGQMERDKFWREEKYKKIKESNTDFVLALENTILPNYMTEKIWDGFAMDKVTMYLGDPNIDNFIPRNCYIDLRPYYNIETDEFDLSGLEHKIRTMTQVEYDDIIKNARKIREWYINEKFIHKNILTTRVINRIKNLDA